LQMSKKSAIRNEKSNICERCDQEPDRCHSHLFRSPSADSDKYHSPLSAFPDNLSLLCCGTEPFPTMFVGLSDFFCIFLE
ncbi:hypothetical protein HPG69_015019, partial [Diceros bicornis minor]